MLTQRLAEFVINTRTSDIPTEVLDASRDALIDTVGVALVGSLDEVGEITLRYVSDLGARREATIWGTSVQTSMAEAAFANGVSGHALDFDDVHASVHGHPSTTLVPAVIAAGEAVGASGKDVLAAYAVGLEVGGKLGTAFGNGHYQRGWHSTATTGVFATAAAVARLLGLNVAQLRNALGLAASQASGLLRNFGTMTKPFHAGHAARCGVQSALLARAGFTADISIFDGTDGFLRTYGEKDAQPLEPLIEKLGKPWEAVSPGISFKRWPCCYCNHRPIGALLAMLKKHDIRAAEVEAIEVGFPPGTDTALIHTNPQTGLEAKFSIEYSAAATVLDGKVGMDSYTDVMVNRPEARALLKKVRRYRIEGDRMYSGATGFNDVLVRTSRGEFKAREDRAPGSPAWPVSAGERDEKFLDCAGRLLGGAGARRVLDMAIGMAALGNVAEFSRAMVPAQERARAAKREPAGAMAK
ncbi:MAG TPA: MmgE/PrpD family protein [Burkholderiales bacterium]|nr:MmgE/PrpD family protein [Burkholderiales bacterium]